MGPTIVVTVQGGCVQDIFTNVKRAPKIIVIDYDCEEFTGHQVDGDDVNVGEFEPAYLPRQVEALVTEAQEENDPDKGQALKPCYPGKVFDLHPTTHF